MFSILRTIFLSSVIISLACCTNIFSTTEYVAVSLPSWPPENAAKHLYPDLVSWDITYFDGTKFVSLNVPSSTKKISFKTQKNAQSQVVAQPVTRHGENTLAFFMPAGCILPFYMEATWQDGWAASVAVQAAQSVSMEQLKKFNWQKLVEDARKKTADSDRDKVKVQANLWYFDMEKIIEAINSQSFPPSNFKSPSKRYFFSSNLVAKNYQYFMENKDNTPMSSPKNGQFYSKEKNTLRMFLDGSKIILQNQDDLENQIPLSQYIFEQDLINSTGEVLLRWQKPVYFLLGGAEIVSVDKRSGTSVKMQLDIEEFGAIFDAKQGSK